MAKKKQKQLSPKFQIWVDARRRFRLSDAHIQMARELGLNPKKLGSIANHDQEKWKSPLPTFIEDLYFERFGKAAPDQVRSIESMVKQKKAKKLEKRKARDERGDQTGNDNIPF